MKPLVSIIIPIYNVENWIRDSLNSALEQTYTNIEYILVDDCGNDNSIEIVKDIIVCHKDKDIKIIHHEVNKGLSEARNTGLKEAKGEYVFFMDSDDLIAKDCIELHVKAVAMYDADFSDGNVSIIGAKHNNFKPYNDLSIINDKQLLYFYFDGLHICGWNKLVKRSFLLDNGLMFKKDMLYEDMLWVLQLCSVAKISVVLPQYTYQYMVRPDSITTKKSDPLHSRKQLNSFVELFNCIAKEFIKHRDKKLKPLQTRWYNKNLLIVKGRILSSALTFKEKKSYDDKFRPFVKYSSGMMRFILSLPFSLFYCIFSIPNKILRRIR